MIIFGKKKKKELSSCKESDRNSLIKTNYTRRKIYSLSLLISPALKFDKYNETPKFSNIKRTIQNRKKLSLSSLTVKKDNTNLVPRLIGYGLNI